MLPLRRALLCSLLTSPLSACLFERPVKDKLDMIEDRAACAARADTLVVLLPGMYDMPQDFVRERFIAAVRERRLSVDLLAPDAHFGYYRTRLVVERLREDVIQPARRLGYRQIWLAGISLGGFGSLLYAKYHADEIDGILLIAPYLGNERLLREIADAGGPSSWKPGSTDIGDHDRELWTWLQSRTTGAMSRIRASGQPDRSARALPPIYIGYGVEDRFAGANRMLAGLLPAGHASTTPGGHEWEPWRRLWENFLDRKLLPSCA